MINRNIDRTCTCTYAREGMLPGGRLRHRRGCPHYNVRFESEADYKVAPGGTNRYVELLLDDHGRPVPEQRILHAWRLFAREGRSYIGIGKILGISAAEAAQWVHYYSRIRALEIAETKDLEIQRSVETYIEVGETYRARMKSAAAKGDEGRTVIAARERVDALLGLDAPKAVASSDAPAPVSIIASLPPETIVALLLKMHERKTKGPEPEET